MTNPQSQELGTIERFMLDLTDEQACYLRFVSGLNFPRIKANSLRNGVSVASVIFLLHCHFRIPLFPGLLAQSHQVDEIRQNAAVIFVYIYIHLPFLVVRDCWPRSAGCTL